MIRLLHAVIFYDFLVKGEILVFRQYLYNNYFYITFKLFQLDQRYCTYTYIICSECSKRESLPINCNAHYSIYKGPFVSTTTVNLCISRMISFTGMADVRTVVIIGT